MRGSLFSQRKSSTVFIYLEICSLVLPTRRELGGGGGNGHRLSAECFECVSLPQARSMKRSDRPQRRRHRRRCRRAPKFPLLNWSTGRLVGRSVGLLVVHKVHSVQFMNGGIRLRGA